MLTINGAIKTSGPGTSAEAGNLTQALVRLRITDASVTDDDSLARFTRHGIVYALRAHALKWTESADVYKSDHAKAKDLPALVPNGYELDADGYVVVDTGELMGLMPKSERGGTKAVKAETIVKAIESGRMSAEELAALKAALANS